MPETSLYPAIKHFLESAGFDVKGEVPHCLCGVGHGCCGPGVASAKRRTSNASAAQEVGRRARRRFGIPRDGARIVLSVVDPIGGCWHAVNRNRRAEPCRSSDIAATGFDAIPSRSIYRGP
jgi:hypothetical protein